MKKRLLCSCCGNMLVNVGGIGQSIYACMHQPCMQARSKLSTRICLAGCGFPLKREFSQSEGPVGRCPGCRDCFE